MHESVYDETVARLKELYAKVPIGNPLEKGVLMGPLIDAQAFERMQQALQQAKEQGGTVFGGERVEVKGCEQGFYVRPALVEMPVANAGRAHRNVRADPLRAALWRLR